VHCIKTYWSKMFTPSHAHRMPEFQQGSAAVGLEGVTSHCRLQYHPHQSCFMIATTVAYKFACKN